MNRITLLLLLFCNALVLSAQDVDKKYLAGALIEKDGRISLERTIPVNKDVPTEQLFDLVDKWAQKTYTPSEEEQSKKTVLLTRKDESYIVCQGDDKLVFKSGFLMVDQTTIKYQLVLRIEVGAVNMKVRNIKYEYQDYDGLEPAENLISDKMAIHKSGIKLNRHYDKFRTFTIDRVDELRESLLADLSLVQLSEIKKAEEKPAPTPSIVSVVSTDEKVAPTPVETKSAVPMVPLTASMPAMDDYKVLEIDKITDVYGAMLKDAKILVISNNSAVPALWGGISSFMGKSVSTSIVASKYAKESAMEDGETYTISFYAEKFRDKLSAFDKADNKASDKIKAAGFTSTKTPAGTPVVEEAWLIIECKKAMVQPIAGSDDSMYMGEVLNAWVK